MATSILVFIQPMQDTLYVYKLDSINTWMKNNSFMGCGLVIITPESLHEKLPYYDVDGKLAGYLLMQSLIIERTI